MLAQTVCIPLTKIIHSMKAQSIVSHPNNKRWRGYLTPRNLQRNISGCSFYTRGFHIRCIGFDQVAILKTTCTIFKDDENETILQTVALPVHLNVKTYFAFLEKTMFLHFFFKFSTFMHKLMPKMQNALAFFSPAFQLSFSCCGPRISPFVGHMFKLLLTPHAWLS